MVEKNVILGLDLGTSILAIAKVREAQQGDRKDDEKGDEVRPSAVYINGAPYVNVAVALDKDLNVVAFGAEALLYKQKEETPPTEKEEEVPPIDKKEEPPIYVFSDFIRNVGQTSFYQVGERYIRANDVALLFLTAVRKDIEECFFNRTKLSDLVSQCVVGIPACIDKDPDSYYGALKQVLTEAGFPDVTFCFNPVAAACYFLSEEELPKHGKSKSIVYQMDSLSSMAAVVDTEPGKVLAPLEPMVFKEYPVGGRQFVDLLLPHYKKELEKKGAGLSPADEMPLRLGIEKLLRIPLSAWWGENRPAEMEITLPNSGREAKLSLSEAEYKEYCKEPIKKLERHILDVFKDFNIPLNSVVESIAAIFFIGEYTYLAHAAKPDTAEFQKIPAPVGERAPLLLAKGLALSLRFKGRRFPKPQTPPVKETRRGLWKYMTAAVLAFLIAWGGPSLWRSWKDAFRIIPEALYAVLEVEQDVCDIRSFDTDTASSDYSVKATTDPTAQWEILPSYVRIWTASWEYGYVKDSFKDYMRRKGNKAMPDLRDMLQNVSDSPLRLAGLVNTSKFILDMHDSKKSQKFSYEPVYSMDPILKKRKISEIRIKSGPEGLKATRVLVLFRERRYITTDAEPLTEGKASLHYGALPPIPSSPPWEYAFERDKKRVTLKYVRVRYKDSPIETTHLPGSQDGVLSVSHDLSSRRVTLRFKGGFLGDVDFWGVSKRWAEENDDTICPDVKARGEALAVWSKSGQERGR